MIKTVSERIGKDRLPPAAIEAEQAVIGCCLIEPVRCIAESQMVIKTSDYFYDLRCRTIWDLICGKNLNGDDVMIEKEDAQTIINFLIKKIKESNNVK